MRIRLLFALPAVIALLAACGGQATPSSEPTDGAGTQEAASEPTPSESAPATEIATPSEPVEATEAASVDATCGASSDREPGGQLLAEVDLTDTSPWQVDGQQTLAGEECLVVIADNPGETFDTTAAIGDLNIETSYGGTIVGVPDLGIEVDAAPLGEGAGFFGAVCGLTKNLKLYLGMSSDGTGVIARHEAGSIQTVALKPGRTSVDTGDVVRLRAECDIGTFEATFSVFADGKKLVSKKVGNVDLLDASDTFELVGVVAGSNAGDTRVSFSNMTLHDLHAQ